MYLVPMSVKGFEKVGFWVGNESISKQARVRATFVKWNPEIPVIHSG